jgi:hypothetical protein
MKMSIVTTLLLIFIYSNAQISSYLKSSEYSKMKTIIEKVPHILAIVNSQTYYTINNYYIKKVEATL